MCSRYIFLSIYEGTCMTLKREYCCKVIEGPIDSYVISSPLPRHGNKIDTRAATLVILKIFCIDLCALWFPRLCRSFIV